MASHLFFHLLSFLCLQCLYILNVLHAVKEAAYSYNGYANKKSKLGRAREQGYTDNINSTMIAFRLSYINLS